MAKMGRPRREFLPEYCDMLIEDLKKGYSFEAFGGLIGASKETLYKWLEENEDFANAKKQGEAYCRRWWENKGKEGLETPKGVTFNSAVWIFNMKNRFGWRDQVEHSGNATITLNYNLDAKTE